VPVLRRLGTSLVKVRLVRTGCNPDIDLVWSGVMTWEGKRGVGGPGGGEGEGDGGGV